MKSGSTPSPLLTPLASPSSTIWTTPLTSPHQPSSAPTTASTSSLTPTGIPASPMDTPAGPSHVQPAFTTSTPQPPQPLAANPAELPSVPGPAEHQQAPESAEERPEQHVPAPHAEPPAKFAIKALRGVGRTLHVSPSPLGTHGSARSHSIVSGLVGQLQGMQHATGTSSIPRKPSRLQEESKPEQLPGPETKVPVAPLNTIIHPGIPIASDKIGFFNHFRKSALFDRQKDASNGPSCQIVEASRPFVDDSQEPSGSEPLSSSEPATDPTLTDAEHELEADLAKLVGSRNPSVGIPDTPSLGHEERGLFSAALRALDSGLGGSLSSSSPSVGPTLTGGLSRKGSGHSLDLPDIAEDGARVQDFLANDEEPGLASNAASA